jgi:hypothetical protein
VIGKISSHGQAVFTAVKYLTYSLLLLNIYLFLQEELGSLEHTFTGQMEFSEFVQVFAATIDTAAWVALLLLFELETYILEDERIRGGVKLALHGVRGIAYIGVLYAFSGYTAELITHYRVAPLPAGWDACARLTADWSILLSLDEYIPLSAENCATLQPPLSRVDGFEIVAEAQPLANARYLAWTDLINAAAWILVVIVLEIEVRLQLRGRLTDTIVRGFSYVKFVLYGTLFVAAAYWGFAGTFLDFWDAFLWLFAFIFIELNVFNWQQETQAEAEAVAAQAVRD